MGRLVVDEVLPCGVCSTPLVGEVEGTRLVLLALGCWVPFLVEVRFEPKAPNPLNREFIKSARKQVRLCPSS